VTILTFLQQRIKKTVSNFKLKLSNQITRSVNKTRRRGELGKWRIAAAAAAATSSVEITTRPALLEVG